MHSTALQVLFGAVLGLIVTVVLGAIFGGLAGLPVYERETRGATGLTGAVWGATSFLWYGGVPCSLVGAFAARARTARQ